MFLDSRIEELDEMFLRITYEFVSFVMTKMTIPTRTKKL